MDFSQNGQKIESAVCYDSILAKTTQQTHNVIEENLLLLRKVHKFSHHERQTNRTKA